MNFEPSYKAKRITKLRGGKIDFARELNEQQYAAVVHENGPALVIAGAGSGKTRTLVYRVAYLIEKGIPSDSILLLTFTNNAAEEMMSRTAQLINRELSGLWGGTFHAIGVRILKRFAGRLGYSQNFTILDREDSEKFLASCMEELKLKESFPKPSVVAEVFSKSVNKQKKIENLIKEEFPHLQVHSEKILKLYEVYNKKKNLANVMDFDDLLKYWFELMKAEPEILDYYQQKFTHILVDEYQDTNKLQTDIVELLASSHRNLMVVGDDAQSIYSWRGANFQNIIDFPKRFPDVKIYKIEYNYRSTPEILEFANSVISRAKKKFSKKLVPVKDHGVKPLVVITRTTDDQARFVAKEIMMLHSRGLKYSDIAVLYRSHFHVMEVQMELQKNSIPFNITSGLKFFEQAHIKDIAAFLRLLSNPYDEASFRRIAEMIEGIGKTTARNLFEQYFASLKVTVPGDVDVNKDERAIQTDNGVPAKRRPNILISELLKHCKPPQKSLKGWSNLIDLFKKIEKSELINKPGMLINTILDAFYEEYLKENYENYEIRMNDLDQFSFFADGFKDVDEFLVKMSLMTNVEAEKTKFDELEENAVTLTTVHQAKGLEFEAVFIIMLCEKYFPNERSSLTPEGEDEERRLFYVAVTRAKSLLYLCYPKSRRGFQYLLFPSPFLTEIPDGLCEMLEVDFNQ